MNKEEAVKKLLEESSTEQYLKEYFNRIERVYGIDIATETALEKESIKDSIEQYSRISEDVNDLDINLAIIKSIVLSNDEDNICIKYAKEKISDGKVDELIQDIISNIHLRRCYIKIFAENVLIPPVKKYERVKDKPAAINNLANLNCYRLQQSLKNIKSLILTNKEAN